MPRWRLFRQFSLRFTEHLLSVSLSGPSWARVALHFFYATLHNSRETWERGCPSRQPRPRGFYEVAVTYLNFLLHLHERDARTLQCSQSPASIIIVVLTIHLGEERQCDPDLSFLFNVSNTMVTTVERSVPCSRLRDSRVRWIEKGQAKRSGTR